MRRWLLAAFVGVALATSFLAGTAGAATPALTVTKVAAPLDGGLIYVSLKHRGEELTTITAHLSKISSRLTEVFAHAQAEKRSPARVADELAEKVLYR